MSRCQCAWCSLKIHQQNSWPLMSVRATLALAPTTRLCMVWVSHARPLTTATRIVELSLLERITIYSKDNTHYNPQRGMWLILGRGVREIKIGSTRQYYKLASCLSLSSEAKGKRR